MLPILLEDDRRQQVGSPSAPAHRLEWRQRLRDSLAVPTHELLPHRLGHLPPTRDHRECLPCQYLPVDRVIDDHPAKIVRQYDLHPPARRRAQAHEAAAT